MPLFISIIIAQRTSFTQPLKNLHMYNIIMYERILMITTKHLTRYTTILHRPCSRNTVRVIRNANLSNIYCIYYRYSRSTSFGDFHPSGRIGKLL